MIDMHLYINCNTLRLISYQLYLYPQLMNWPVCCMRLFLSTQSLGPRVLQAFQLVKNGNFQTTEKDEV